MESTKLDQMAREMKLSRDGVYHTDPTIGLTNLGKMWAAILSEHLNVVMSDLPPHVVSLMMAAVKIARAARPFDKRDDDSYVDGVAYMQFAMDCDPTRMRQSPDSFPIRCKHAQVGEADANGFHECLACHEVLDPQGLDHTNTIFPNPNKVGRGRGMSTDRSEI